MNKDFKVMFVFFNDRMRTGIPLNISYLSGALKINGYKVVVFDTSFYEEHGRLHEEKKKEEAGIFKMIDYSSIGVKIKKTSIRDDLDLFIIKEKPDLIAFSVFSQAKKENIALAEHIKLKFNDIPVIFGGIHVNIEPDKILSNECVDYICIGEGEDAIVELADDLLLGGRGHNVANIGYKVDGQIKINKVRAPKSMNLMPTPDWTSFDLCHTYGPYRGNLLRMALVEYSRTCPYRCTYCGNEIIIRQYDKSGKKLRYRHKSPEKFVRELRYYKDKYAIEFVNIVDGTFVAQREEVLEELSSLYSNEVNLPFFCDATIHCVTPKKVELLRKMGCVCVNMGIECANEEYRSRYLDKKMTNQKIVNSFLIVREGGLDTRSYNIIGLPFQTRHDIIETIELNKECKVGSVSLSIFMPYEGTKLRELCIKEKLLSEDRDVAGDGTYPIIKNPYLTDAELIGLYNTFSLYVKLEKCDWPLIERAETDKVLRDKLLEKMDSLLKV